MKNVYTEGYSLLWATAPIPSLKEGRGLFLETPISAYPLQEQLINDLSKALSRPTKWFAIACLALIWTLIPQRAYAQVDSVGVYVLDVEELALSEALSYAADLTNIDLAYAPELVVGKTSTCVIETASVADLLTCVLEDTGLEAYELSGGAYLIRRTRSLRQADEQRQTPGFIQGTVYTDSSNHAIPGAHVVVKGTFFGDAADREGMYLIKNVPPGEYAIEASSIGFRPVSEDDVVISPGDTVTVAFVLDEQPVVLRPVTVVANYNRFTHNLSRQLPLSVQSVEVFGMGVGLLMNANATREARFQLSTLGNFAGMGVSGLQLSAGVNYTGGGVRGVQIGAVGNQAAGRVKGIQLSGVYNSTQQAIWGMQAAGATNIAWQPVVGMQAAGAFNVAAASLRGLQTAGAANAAGHLDGAQVAGAVNLSADLRGVQIAGAVNQSATLEGLQIAGAVNQSRERFVGIQAAGAINVSEGDFHGLQASGFLNVADTLHGLQVGIINIADKHRGVPLGLFNYVHEVGVRMDTWVDDVGLVTLAARSGNRHVASFLGVGTYTHNGRQHGAVMYGLGYDYFWSNRVRTSLDAMYYGLSFTDFTALMKLRLVVGFEVIKDVAVFAGPTFNAYASPESKRFRLTSRSSYDDKVSNTWYQLWPGFVAGIRLL